MSAPRQIATLNPATPIAMIEKTINALMARSSRIAQQVEQSARSGTMTSAAHAQQSFETPER
jgi:hypothetical protein